MATKIAAYLLTFLWLVSVAGCNTVRGFGQDLQKAGEAIEEAIN
jgi:predicted small secreted protein